MCDFPFESMAVGMVNNEVKVLSFIRGQNYLYVLEPDKDGPKLKLKHFSL